MFTVNLSRVVFGRVPGMATNYLGYGLLERTKGAVLHDSHLLVTVFLTDEEARDAINWIVENKSHPFPLSFPAGDRIVGVDLVEGQLAPSLSR